MSPTPRLHVLYQVMLLYHRTAASLLRCDDLMIILLGKHEHYPSEVELYLIHVADGSIGYLYLWPSSHSYATKFERAISELC